MINLTLFLSDYHNKDTISDYKELKECFNNNIEGCKLLMKGF